MSEESPYTEEVYMTATDLVLVDGRQVNMGAGAKIGEDDAKPGYFITLEGRVNKTQDRKVIHLFMEARFGFEMAGEMLDRMEMMMALARQQQEAEGD